MKTQTKKTETIWKSDWKLGGLADTRLGIELNRNAKTILIWTQRRKYILNPALKRTTEKHLTKDQADRIFKRTLEFDLFDEAGPSSTEEITAHMNLGPKHHQVNEYLKLYEKYRRVGHAEDFRTKMTALVKDGTAWLKRSTPQLAMAISFKKRLPALYVFVRAKKKRKPMVQNRTWNAEGMLRSNLLSVAETDEPTLINHICVAATNLLGRECRDLTDVLRPTIKERLGPYFETKIPTPRLKMEWCPHFIRPMFTHDSFIEGVAKISGNRGKKTRQLVARLVARNVMDTAEKKKTYEQSLFLAYLGRRMISADDTQKLLERERGDEGHHAMCNTKIAPRLRKRLKNVPASHRGPWLISFKNVEYCQDTLDTLHQILQADIECDWKDVPKNGNDAHDYLARMLVKKNKEGMYKHVLEITEKFKQLHGSVVDLGELKATFRLPENKGEIFEWGETQHHCIASYADGHAKGECVLVEVAIGSDRYHLQLKNKRIIQFYGKYNAAPPEDVDKAVRKYLTQKKFVKQD